MPSKAMSKKHDRDVTVGKLLIVHEGDEDHGPPEMSGDPDYKREDEQRIRDWENQEFHFLGIYLEIELVVLGTIQTIRTPGLWGIESDSDDGYFKEVAGHEYDELVDILKALGVSEDQVTPLARAKQIDR